MVVISHLLVVIVTAVLYIFDHTYPELPPTQPSQQPSRPTAEPLARSETVVLSHALNCEDPLACSPEHFVFLLQ